MLEDIGSSSGGDAQCSAQQSVIVPGSFSGNGGRNSLSVRTRTGRKQCPACPVNGEHGASAFPVTQAKMCAQGRDDELHGSAVVVKALNAKSEPCWPSAVRCVTPTPAGTRDSPLHAPRRRRGRRSFQRYGCQWKGAGGGVTTQEPDDVAPLGSGRSHLPVT